MYSAPATVDNSFEDFLKLLQEDNERIQPDLIRKAFAFSWDAHRHQLRKSGEPFMAHPVAVALILGEQHLDSVTIAAGLLHDILEDTDISHDMLEAEFGSEITRLVDGVTKIKKIESVSREQRQAETYRKMLLSMSNDIRVIIIKFADRLHNLRTLKYLAPQRIKAIAHETLDIYAPLAHRLGMAKIKWELEDLAFKHLHPQDYKSIVAKVVGSRREREMIIDSFAAPFRRRLKEEKLKATIIGRPKHFYSIYRKMQLYNRPFEEIYDLLAIRVITDTIKDCYHILGIVHSIWKPIQDRFKDYLSTPKSNGYQSLHTTVVGSKGNILEIQIRTWEMNHVAEDGIAAHWLYKNPELQPSDSALSWLRNLIEWQEDLTDSTEFFEYFKIDLFHAEIFIFTPKGDLITLPKGATVLDFAFSVHTDLGLHCIGAKVDGEVQPASAVLVSGATVEILHSSSRRPSLDWLNYVRTPKARSAIRRYLKSKGRRESIELGKKVLKNNFKKLQLNSPLVDYAPDLLHYLGLHNLDQLYEHLGKGNLPISRLMHFFGALEKHKSMPSRVVSRLVNTFAGKNQPVSVGPTDNVMIRFAKCCNPIPGDVIIGFVTRGRGIAVHRTDCRYAPLFNDTEERVMEVGWDDDKERHYLVSLEITGKDRPGLLHEMSGVFLNFGANVLEATVGTREQQVYNTITLEIQNKNQLRQIFSRLQKIKGIDRVRRTHKNA
ncbi:MAG: RelA/SpoT family protein [Chitinivibrionales bacterium]|nr:RelA/SpoT family protein [Chitinivibrionales bacterium]